MAKPVKLGKFYLFLGAVALVGGGAIWMATSSGGGTGAGEPIPVAALNSSFRGYELGSDSAPLEIVEFSDFQCPFCARFAVLNMPDIHERLIATGRVRWRFRDFPLSQHQHSMTAHHAAACANEQGLFWPMHDQLFYNQSDWSRRRRVEGEFEDYARAIGADVDRYEDCMDSGRYRGQIAAGVEEGVSIGINSTPTLIIGNRRYSGSLAFDQLMAIVDSLAPASGD